MTFTPKTAYIVSHTHWDREWYLPFHAFRVNLSRTIKQILEALEHEPGFNHFLLDGQAVLIEDYLELHPEDDGRIREHVAAGRLSIGPWYILPDEFLVTAEATVRNLQIGHRVCARYGGTQKVGYMPDSFGHIAQMPEIMEESGITSFIFTRGNGDEIDETGWEFRWVSPGLSIITAINQCRGYCNAGGLGYEELWHAHTRRSVDPGRAVAQVRELFDAMGERANGDFVLLMNGCDHFPPQRDFARIMDALREAFPETEFRHTNLTEYTNAVEAAGLATKMCRNELRHGKLHNILTGVLSARMNLKQLNDQATRYLTDIWEPLAAYSRFMLGFEYPTELIDAAWKLLLKNHPHDSICGCSTDEVHREMVPRFDGVLQAAQQSVANIMERIAPTFARRAEDDHETVLTVFNPLPYTRTRMVERLVVLQPGDYDPADLVLYNPAGEEVPYQVVDQWYIERFWGVDYRTMTDIEEQLDRFSGYLEDYGERIIGTAEDRATRDCFLLIRFVGEELPPLGHVNYRLAPEPGHRHDEPQGEVVVTENTIENTHCRVEVHRDGTIDIEHKLTGRRFNGLNVLESTEDAGDEYDYSPAPETCTVTSRHLEGELRVVEAGGLRGAIEARFNMPLPARLNPDRQRRSAELVDCPVSVLITLNSGNPVVDIDLCLDNAAEDHRLRALFPAGVNTGCIFTDGQFHVNKRPLEEPAGEGWAQPPVGTYPQQDFTALQEDLGDGLAVISRGLPEIAPLRDDRGTGLALTLLRCVGWLSRDDLATRQGNAGPTVPTPDAQCPGPHRIRYAVYPYQRYWAAARMRTISQDWRTPCLVIQGVADQSIPGRGGLYELRNDSLAITSIKRCEERDTLLIRMFNQVQGEATVDMHMGLPVKGAWETDLLNNRTEIVPVLDGNRPQIIIDGFRFLTLEVEFDYSGE